MLRAWSSARSRRPVAAPSTATTPISRRRSLLVELCLLTPGRSPLITLAHRTGITVNPNRIASIALLSALMLATAEARAQSTLALNGQTSIFARLGDTVVVTVTGQVGMPVLLMLDTDPGPTPLFGLSVPLGFTAGFVAANLG